MQTHIRPAGLVPSTFAQLALGLALAAQCPPGAPMPQDLTLETSMPASGPAQARLQTALAALENGDPATAREHLRAALEFHPSSPELLLELVLACGDDADLLSLWTERYVRAAGNDKGRIKLDVATRKRLDAVPGAREQIEATQTLAAQRTAAVAELARYIERHKVKGKQNAERALLVHWASQVLLDVAAGGPNAIARVATDVADVQRSFEPDYDVVYESLAQLVRMPRPKTKEGAADAPVTGVSSDVVRIDDQRVRAARILVGLRRQVAFEDLQGSRPMGPGRLADEAQQLLTEERTRDVEQGKVWTIAELTAMSPEQAERFTHEHRHWHAPGLATSTTGRYRIETICGHDTLLQAARTIELHHERLVAHFGKDPFEQRPGIARIVPESADLETEGAPYWWAGGFQSGDRTTVRFAWGNIPGLGRTLTHELTHRFDGVLRPFLPSWYIEGHADWTGAHYARMADEQFVDDFLKVRTVAHTFYKGYGGKNKFVQLLEGKVDDYRDNYFAGYSLYSFLRSYPPGAPRYHSALEKFERNARGSKKDPLAYFTSTFCDGKDGRPAEFDELHEEWQGFVRGCYEWLDGKQDGNRWIASYGGLGKGDPAPLVMDAPTWSWARTRAEPFYGQDHAAAATLLLHEAGDVDGTIAAGVWSLTADGWRPDVTRALCQALRASKHEDAAAAFATIAHAHYADVAVEAVAGLAAALQKTRTLMTSLAERAETLAGDGKPRAAAATMAEHRALARWFGTTAPANAEVAVDLPASLPRHLGSAGFTESGLTDFEDRRRQGLWYVTPEGDLHVGREKPREATGVLDRRAHQRDAFAHSVAWQAPGNYVLRGRIHFTTSFASGAIVFGHTRRDRDLRLRFSSGDFAYAIGKSETNGRKGRVRFNLRGLWERDGNDKLPETSPSQTVEIPDEQSWFEYALHVRGPRVLVEINGEPLMRYAVHDGTPIEGQIGFAMDMGAIRVQQPTVQRLDSATGATTTGLDIKVQPTVGLDELMLLPTRGIPIDPNGTLVLLLPKLEDEDSTPIDRLGRALRRLSKLLTNPLDYPQQWVLAVPRGIHPDDKKDAIAAIEDMHPGDLPVVEHAVAAPFGGDDPWVLFVDAQGVLRAAAEATGVQLTSKVEKWSRRFRAR